MSFLVAAALALGLFVVAPVAAHLLRRGRAREQEFPPAELVPVAYRSARKRSRLEDRWLLLIRALLILTISIIGAVPFVRCQRLALDRDAGASVALALIVDDSLSMQTLAGESTTRWERAIRGAHDLLDSTREGDAVCVILAGSPARLALSATTDLGAVRETLDDLSPADRSTDLDAAVRLAESALKALPHVDKRIAVLSDFATETERFADKQLWAPLPELRNASQNCGIVRAQLEGRRVTVRIACTSADAAKGRKVELTVGLGTKPNRGGEQLAQVELKAQAGTQVVDLTVPEAAGLIDAFLSGNDALEQDDYAPVARAESALLIGVVADPTTAAAQEGTATVIEQALSALSSTETSDLGRSGEVRPLPLMPEDTKELESYAALVVDDPPGLTPEARSALADWLKRGGLVAAFLGPNVEAAQLGASFEPFAQGALTWEPTKAPGIGDAKNLLGEAGASFANLAAKGRVRLGGALFERTEVMLHWTDEAPWMLKRQLGRGQIWTFGLPVSVYQSDLALRPGFLALLERFVHEAAQSSGQRITEAGTPWRLNEGVRSIEGPSGKIEPHSSQSAPGAAAESSPSPAVRGRYRVIDDNGNEQVRIVTVDEGEVVSQPGSVSSANAPRVAATSTPNVEVSSEFALLLMALIFGELLLRFISRLRLSNQNTT